MCVCVSVCTHKYRYLQGSEEGVGFTGNEIKCTYDPLLMRTKLKRAVFFFVLFCFNSLAISPTQRITPFKSLWQYLKTIVKMYRFINI